ncbi:MAG: hypothetical protein ACPGXK_04060 [Phycisphaerae bacterium]
MPTVHTSITSPRAAWVFGQVETPSNRASGKTLGNIRLTSFRSLILALGMLTLVGCVSEGESLFTPSAETGDTVQGRSSVVTVRFVNRSINAAVDVEFFSTQTADLALPNGLFDASFSIQRDIGLAGTGILPPTVTDTIDLPCTENLTLGTQGGLFSDASSGDPLGSGDARWLEDGPIGLCGSVVTFEFIPRGADSYTTQVLISR